MIEIQSISDVQLLKESEELECKKSTGRDGKGEIPKDFWETYSAMANTDGGVVLLGVEEKKGAFRAHDLEHIGRLKKELFDNANNRKKASVNLLTNKSVHEIRIGAARILAIEIPRAKRQDRPVFLNGDPLGNSYVRLHEADQRLTEAAVKRMLAEQSEESRDERVLPHYDLDDLNMETLRSYRQVFTNREPSHPWNELDLRTFLTSIGGRRKNRETGEEGLTAAGLLMFGTHPVIQEVFPFYMLDYQERPEAKTEKRWIDRVTLDGTWSGNLYDFYRRIYAKLIEGMKKPFELEGDQRKDETPAHVALREALCNVLVHADYSDRCSVLVVKRPDLFGFRNPGLMRTPIEFALQGGFPDCRNRKLHQMFRYVGIGDQAGSGLPKILSGWHKYHWRPPELEERREPFDQTILRMRMIDLFPPELVDGLTKRFGAKYERLPHREKVALAIAAIEDTVANRRLCALGNIHPADASQCLRYLVAEGFLEQTGSSRGAVYHIVGAQIPGPEDVFDSPNLKASSPNSESSSPILKDSSPILRTERARRNGDGLLVSETHELPFIDDLGAISGEYLSLLKDIAKEAREKKKIPRASMEEILIKVTRGHFVTVSCLAELVSRKPETLGGQYLSKMVKSGRLEIAFPRTPNDPRQAYTSPYSSDESK